MWTEVLDRGEVGSRTASLLRRSGDLNSGYRMKGKKKKRKVFTRQKERHPLSSPDYTSGDIDMTNRENNIDIRNNKL